jgi:multidrug efflux pump subunit AcrA (membrane-fusion protein)
VRVLIILLLSAALLAQPDRLRIGEIEFYGYAGLDLAAQRAALPVHEGDTVSEDQMEALIARIKETVQATAVNAVCCDDQHGLMIYIGLAGQSARDVPYNPAPRGRAKFPRTVTELEAQYSDALTQAISKGASAEDQSQGYALSADPALRAKQLALRDYATSHPHLILRVLDSSSDSAQRAIAAQLLGYARESQAQIAALVRASHDPEDEVRNNATRALWVLAASSPKRAARIPAEGFIEMLYSRSWTDRNKSSLLLEALTRARDPKLLAELRSRAFDPLVEMLRWRSNGHASAARLILGRCAGIDEARLEKLVEAGDTAPILAAL